MYIPDPTLGLLDQKLYGWDPAIGVFIKPQEGVWCSLKFETLVKVSSIPREFSFLFSAQLPSAGKNSLVAESLPRVIYYPFIKTLFNCFTVRRLTVSSQVQWRNAGSSNHPSIKMRALAISSPKSYFSQTRVRTSLSPAAVLNVLLWYHQDISSKFM